MRRPWILPALVLAVVAVAAASGCSPETPMEPADLRTGPAIASAAQPGVLLAAPRVDNKGLVDLDLDRLTVVEGSYQGRTILTGQEPGPWVTGTFAIERRVVGLSTPVFGGPTYVRESVRHLEETGGFESEDRWRQDRSGLFLYQEDAAIATSRLRVAAARALALTPTTSAVQSAAFARAIASVERKREAILVGPPGGPLSSEITFLRYPFHKGASWDGRVGFNVWTVEDVEWIDLPGGRMRAAKLSIVVPEAFGPDDEALTWWDKPGEVKRQFHLFGAAVDDQGNEIGRYESFETFELVEYTAGTTPL